MKGSWRLRRIWIWPVLLIGLGLGTGIALAWGPSGWLSWVELPKLLAEVWWGENDPRPEATVLWQVRMPRVVLAILVGSSLAVAGVLMQALFHNPLAEPYVVGVSSGAAFGAVMVLTSGLPAWASGSQGLALAAFAGATVATLIVYRLSRLGYAHSPATLLLTGIAVGGVLQSITTLRLLQAEAQQVRNALVWLMGSLAYRDWSHVLGLAPYAVLAIGLAWRSRETLNVMATGEATAHHLGVAVERTRFGLLMVAALLAGAAVAVAGIVAFVGLMVPHLMRLFVGADHRRLIPASVLGGAFCVLASDLIARRLAPDREIPIGIVTGILGSLFFLYLVQRYRRAAAAG